jgi:hypothetical protein
LKNTNENSEKIRKIQKKSKYFTIFFCIFHIISQFSLLFFPIFHIFSLFNLLFPHIFHIISQFSFVFSISLWKIYVLVIITAKESSFSSPLPLLTPTETPIHTNPTNGAAAAEGT